MGLIKLNEIEFDFKMITKNNSQDENACACSHFGNLKKNNQLC